MCISTEQGAFTKMQKSKEINNTHIAEHRKPHRGSRMRLVETTVFVCMLKCYRYSNPISEIRMFSEKQAHHKTLFSDASSVECRKKYTAKACQAKGESCFLQILLYKDRERPQWPDWVDSNVHNILQKVSSGRRMLELVMVNKTQLWAWTSQVSWMGSDSPAKWHLSPFRLLFFPLSLHLTAGLAHVAGYTLPSADGKQITRHIKGPLSVHRLSYTCTNTHSHTQDNRASAGARVRGGWIQGVEGRGGVGEYGTAPHKGSPEIAPSHNETCHSVYEIMSNWKHCSHCAPVTGSIVQIALSPPTSLFPLTRRDCSSPLWQPYSLSLFLCLSISPSLCIVIISLLICFLFRFSFHSPADLLFTIFRHFIGICCQCVCPSVVCVRLCVCEQVSISQGDKNRKQDKILFWDEMKPLQASQRDTLVFIRVQFLILVKWNMALVFRCPLRQAFMWTTEIVLIEKVCRNSPLLTLPLPVCNQNYGQTIAVMRERWARTMGLML